MTSGLCLTSKPELLNYPPSVEPKFKTHSFSPSHACEYHPFLKFRKTEERGKSRRERFTPSGTNAVGFSFISHSIYQIDPSKTFYQQYNPLELFRKAPPTVPSNEVLFSENFFTVDYTSDFLPKSIKRVNLQITNVKKDLSFSGDSQFLWDE
ncbi:MAG: hypothetical protein JXQ65_03965 [Candidatus Marinimicrobia bacterium]|nr:hypothetical protein [Candidatus Neomarinimicrobiota bacterium]